MSFKATRRKDSLLQTAYYINLPDGSKKRQYVYAHTKQELVEKRNQAIADSINKHPVITANITLGQYLSNWLPTARGIRESTRANYAGELRKHVIPFIGQTKLSHLSSAKLQTLMDALIKQGRSPRTTQIVRNILSKALREAENRNLVAPNLLKHVELEKYVPKETLIWSDEEAEHFLSVARDSPYRFFFELYLTYGLRRGEALALTWDDIDFKAGIIHINKQLTYVGKEAKICPLKTQNSKRDLPIVEPLASILNELYLQRQKNVTFIITKDGYPVSPSALGWEFKRLKKQASVTDVKLHSLRHYAATTFKRKGIQLKDAQEILGHASITTTLNHYQHSDIEDKRRALERLKMPKIYEV